MAKTTFEVTHAFIFRKKRKIRNDSTDGNALFFHGNKIAWWGDNYPVKVWITNCGWFTPSTKERLNSISDKIVIIQHKGLWYIQGRESQGAWDGKPIELPV